MLLTERTRVDAITVSDAEELHRYFERNLKHLEPWEPERTAGYHDLGAWKERARDQQRCAREGKSYHFAVRIAQGDEIKGICNFNSVSRGAFLACYLGYSIDSRSEGHGLMFEALSTLIPFVFDTFGLHRIMANYMPSNERSGKLLHRLGFEKEGFAKSYLKIAGRWEDHVLTARVNSA
ncbi:GNAT family N-acetyltransferase [Synechococcus sp. MU1644]|nr:GNAT family N-acetyltransferase [Synechococcus sp. MU1644]